MTKLILNYGGFDIFHDDSKKVYSVVLNDRVTNNYESLDSAKADIDKISKTNINPITGGSI